MILFFRTPSKSVIAVESNHPLAPDDSDKLCWLFGEAKAESVPKEIRTITMSEFASVTSNGRGALLYG